MAIKNCVITLDPAVVDTARANAHKIGKNLKEIIEDTITGLATAELNGPWISERELKALPWAPTRVALWNMRKRGRLVSGQHYWQKGRFIYYDRAALEAMLKNKNGTAESEAENNSANIENNS